MAVNITQNERKVQTLKTIQDRPIPIETHGVNDKAIDRLTANAKIILSKLKPSPLKDAVNSLVEALKISRDDKTKFDVIRRNIETLWKSRGSSIPPATIQRVGTAIAAAGSQMSPARASIKDEEFFGYDVEGEEAVGIGESELTLDTKILEDNGFSHTAGNADITISKGGFCDIDGDASFDMNEGDILEFKLQVDSGSGWVDVEGSKSYCGA